MQELQGWILVIVAIQGVIVAMLTFVVKVALEMRVMRYEHDLMWTKYADDHGMQRKQT